MCWHGFYLFSKVQIKPTDNISNGDRRRERKASAY